MVGGGWRQVAVAGGGGGWRVVGINEIIAVVVAGGSGGGTTCHSTAFADPLWIHVEWSYISSSGKVEPWHSDAVLCRLAVAGGCFFVSDGLSPTVSQH
jgi:hypothetical protein